MVDRFPMPIPFGWFFVSYSNELEIGDVKPVRYFGEDLVLYRTEGASPVWPRPIAPIWAPISVMAGWSRARPFAVPSTPGPLI